MKLDITTICGAVAGAAFAISNFPGVPKSVASAAGIIGAAAIGALGWHAKSCPPNCPGTDGQGNPVRQVPSALRRIVPVACFLVLLATLAFVLLTGCAINRVSTRSTGTPGSTNAVEKTTITSCTFLDSNQSIAKASAHSGYATNGIWAPGITMSGLGQSASSTGLVLRCRHGSAQVKQPRVSKAALPAPTPTP